MVRRCLWYRNLVNEEALAQWGMSRQKHTNKGYPFNLSVFEMKYRYKTLSILAKILTHRVDTADILARKARILPSTYFY